MVKLSSYSNGYEEGKYELKPWEFWTEEQRSHVIWQAYESHYLNSSQIKSYLQISRNHMWTQFLGPAVVAGAYFGFLKDSLFRKWYRKSPNLGKLGGVAIVGVSTVLWMNLNPFYIKKEKAQQQTLDTLYHKIGLSMKLLNNALPRSRTSGQIDRYSMYTYFMRNFINKEDGDDFMPPLLLRNVTHNYENKKIYQ